MSRQLLLGEHAMEADLESARRLMGRLQATEDRLQKIERDLDKIEARLDDTPLSTNLELLLLETLRQHGLDAPQPGTERHELVKMAREAVRRNRQTIDSIANDVLRMLSGGADPSQTRCGTA